MCKDEDLIEEHVCEQLSVPAGGSPESEREGPA